MAARLARPALWALVLACVVPHGARGQLLSPGKLAAPHQEMEGLRHCTSCHQLGKSGVAADRCLTCHESMEARIRTGSGYHATVPSDDCASCHQEHLGEQFDLVRFDEASFDHDETGYPLELSHAALECRTCHEPGNVRDPLVLSEKVERGALARTFLGLPVACVGCHREEDPHGEQFGAHECADCHDAGDWKAPAAFDHSTTAFPLEGLHEGVACARCHGSGPSARYADVAFGTCGDCHTDPHRGAMTGTCAGCHAVGGWHMLRSTGIEGAFDHSRASFALRGAHATTACTACHQTGRPLSSDMVQIAYRPGTASRTYPLPIADTCASCHVDRHVFPSSARRWTRCADCHSEAQWSPSAFGVTRHDQSAFPLAGAHVATPCVACHLDSGRGHTRFTLSVPGERCADCHADDDPHAGRYVGFACEACHGSEAFAVVAFDHGRAAQTCAQCHGPEDPHAGQFEGRDCSSCHGTETFTLAEFDHSTTRYPLDGAHEGAPCAACHRPDGTGDGTFVRYRPLGMECTDCHGGVQ